MRIVLAFELLGLALIQFASELEFETARIHRLQRKMERSCRATNPDNYNSNGTVKKGKKKWNNSKTYSKTGVLSEIDEAVGKICKGWATVSFTRVPTDN
jgi:DNA-binding transcriptional regulator WhiA